jgi:hypothetical protein
MNRFRSAVLTTAAGLALLGGCAKTATDDALATNIKAGLYSDATTKPANISVAVKDGVVTLTGDVTSSDIALEAMKVVNGTTGVRSVNDQLTVNGASAANQAPESNAPMPAPAPVPGVAPPPMPNGPPAANNQPPVSPVPSEETVTIPAGEPVTVRTIDPIDSKTNQTGQVFRASLNTPVVSHGRTVVPAGSDATLLLTDARGTGRIEGRAALEVRLVELRVHGEKYTLDSSVYSAQGASRGKQTAVRTGIGAAAGAVIGAIAGGGKGAAIGSAAGGGAGFGSDFFTHGPRVSIPSESLLTFRLEAPLTVKVRRRQEP